MHHLPKKNTGFSLLELLITLCILSILLTLAIPLSRDWLVKNRTLTTSDALIQALYYARNLAISRNETIIFCPSENHRTCNTNWNSGQLAMNKTGTIFRVLSPLPATDTLTWNSSGGQDNILEWLASGFTNGQRGTFYYCTSQAKASFSKKIILLDTGRIYSAEMTPEEYKNYCTRSALARPLFKTKPTHSIWQNAENRYRY